MLCRYATVLGKSALVIDSRSHFGGNCYDYRCRAACHPTPPIRDRASAHPTCHVRPLSLIAHSRGRCLSFPTLTAHLVSAWRARDPDTGILMNKYGAHLFHTNSDKARRSLLRGAGSQDPAGGVGVAGGSGCQEWQWQRRWDRRS